MRNKLPKDFRAIRRPAAGYRARAINAKAKLRPGETADEAPAMLERLAARGITEGERESLNTTQGLLVDGPQPATEADYFYRCEVCGQMVDERRLGDVLHHDQPVHKRLLLD